MFFAVIRLYSCSCIVVVHSSCAVSVLNLQCKWPGFCTLASKKLIKILECIYLSFSSKLNRSRAISYNTCIIQQRDVATFKLLPLDARLLHWSIDTIDTLECQSHFKKGSQSFNVELHKHFYWYLGMQQLASQATLDNCINDMCLKVDLEIALT